MTFRTLLTLSAAALLAACGGSDSAAGPNDPTENPGGNPNGTAGSVTATVGGGLTKSIAGTAMFAHNAGEGFMLAFGSDDDGFIFSREVAGSLPVGTHPVWDTTGDDDAPTTALVGVFNVEQGATSWLCTTTGGTMTITESGASRLRGTMNITGVCATGGSDVTREITVTAQFTAVGGAG